jgi:hypothetical protein
MLQVPAAISIALLLNICSLLEQAVMYSSSVHEASCSSSCSISAAYQQHADELTNARQACICNICDI